jgi:hypothetical protein
MAGKCKPALVDPPEAATTDARGIFERFARHECREAANWLFDQTHHRSGPNA